MTQSSTRGVTEVTTDLSRRVRILTIVSLLLVIAVLGVTGYGVVWLMSRHAPRTTLEAQYQRAKDVFDANPNDEIANQRMGAVLVEMGRYGEGETYYLRALELAPKDAQLRFNLANAYVAMGRADDALQAALKAEELAPGVGPIQYLLGTLYEKMNDPAKAKEHLKKAIFDDPFDGDAMFLLGKLLLKSGDKKGAAEQFSRVKAMMKDYPGIDAALKSAGVESTTTTK